MVLLPLESELKCFCVLSKNYVCCPFIVRYWAGHVTDSDVTGGGGVYGGSENCIPTCSWKIWREEVT